MGRISMPMSITSHGYRFVWRAFFDRTIDFSLRFGKAALDFAFPCATALYSLPDDAPLWKRGALLVGGGIELAITVVPPIKGAVSLTEKAVFQMGNAALVRQAEKQLFRSAEKTTAIALEKQIIQRTAAAEEKVILDRFNQAASELSEVGQNNIRVLRNWAKSKGWEKFPNPGGQPEKWGQYIEGEFEWRLRIKPEGSFRSGLDSGSNIPRFDARLSTGKPKEYLYINPFSGETGTREIGSHLPLDYFY
jgi:hypothetical protein